MIKRKTSTILLALTLLATPAVVTGACADGETAVAETTVRDGDVAPTEAADGLRADDGATASDSASYALDGTSVTVSEVSIGSGQDAITYYVADLWLAQGEDLQSAFSSGGFGGEAEETSDVALANDAVVAINGDYYSARDDGIIIRNGVIYRDLPARTGLAIYQDGTMEVYEEANVSAEELLADGVWNTYSFGPALIDVGELVAGVDEYEADPGARHGIQGTNPRTGIGIIEPGHFVFVVVDGRDTGYSRGVTLSEFADIFWDLGCTTAYNLDGGGSSTLYFMGEVVNQPSQDRGERSVSDILFVG